jgi:hypothetical protein
VRAACLFLALALTPAVTEAQSVQFGVRGLGIPGRSLATRAIGSGGGFGLFDLESSLNPAALVSANTLTSIFTLSQAIQTVENPAGTADTRVTRFPQLMVAGPVRTSGLGLGVSYSNYTSRDFTLETSGTIDLRGVPVGITDSFISRGGLSDFRFAAGYRLRGQMSVGVGLHLITGSNRLESHRSFTDPDSAYVSSLQRAEISFAGVGLSAGLLRQFGPRFAVATMVRWDDHLKIDRDSSRVGTVDLPFSFGLGMQWQPASTLNLAGQAIYRTWSAANSDLLEQGGTGAENTLEVAAGGEYTPDPKLPTRWPIRFGGHYARLPFPLVPGQSGDEIGVSAGTGMRFGQQRAGIDLAVEHVWRSEDVYSEHGFILWLGVSVRP